MEQKVLKRLEELTTDLENLYKERSHLISAINDLDYQIQGVSRSIMELKSLLDSSEQP
jgi:chromosome segregation ATPase